MNEVKPDAGTSPLFYCKPVKDKGGPCHASDCDLRSGCMLQMKRQQHTKDGKPVTHQDHFRLLKRLGGGQPPSFPWHARPQSHEIQDFLSNLGFSKEFCDPCLGHDTIWRPGQEMKVYVDNINM